jgi:hypothetical protein
MLERCFVRPETLGQIHSSWMGQAIEQYAAWLRVRGYRQGTLATRVSLLGRFGKFAQTHGAQRYEDLPAHVEPFLAFWLQCRHPRRASAPLRPPVTRHVRVAIEQMLHVAVPGFVSRSPIGRRGFRPTCGMSADCGRPRSGCTTSISARSPRI